MRRTKFQRVTALVLTLVFLLCGGVSISAATATAGSSNPASTLLNLGSYGEYLAENAGVPNATEAVDIPVDSYEFTLNGVTYNKDSVVTEADQKAKAIAYMGEWGGRTGVLSPSVGTISFTTDKITSAAKYNLVIECYPVEGKSAAVERVFTINGVVPFSEARTLSIAKVWKNQYANAAFLLEEGENPDEYLAKAMQAGIAAYAEPRANGTYIVYKMPDVWNQNISEITDAQLLRFFTQDIDKNEIRSSLVQAPEWTAYEFKDVNGFYQEPFTFVCTPDENGKVTVSFDGVNEPLVIGAVRLVPVTAASSYESYLAAVKAQYAAKFGGEVPEGKDKVKIESEFFYAASSQTIYPVEDRTSAITSPTATDRTVLNVVGGEKWQSAGQWITYKFTVNSRGFYEIAARFRQALLDGMFTSRAIYLYSDASVAQGDLGYYDGIPFAEANNLRFGFSSDWQSEPLDDGNVDGFQFYFEEGVVYTIKFEVALGSMGDIVNRVQSSLDSINADDLEILKLTGSNPDEYRDYGFNRIMPDVMMDLVRQAIALEAVSADLIKVAGDKSSMTATLEDIARTLRTMGTDESKVAANLEQLKTNIGSLGTWLGDAKTQPLQLDFISVQGASEELPEAEAGFWKSLVYEITRFIKSFFRNYDRMGAMVEVDSEDSVEVWLAYGRDQSQVIRSLVNNDFTPATNVAVNLKLVSGGTLLPSILSGMGPDVYIGLGQSDVINYAIRGALVPIQDMEGFRDIALYYQADENFNKIYDADGNPIVNNKAQFNEAAMLVLGIEDAEGDFKYYGLPEQQLFNMMFVRNDVLADLGIKTPETWDDVLEAIPILQANNMEIGMHTDYKVFLYQMNGELYADDGMRINLDSNVALDAFNTMCNMYTMYSFPYVYDFANRFRTGEMPIGFSAYTTTYNQLKVFATEIEGLWSFYPMPGYADENGDVNRLAVSIVSAVVMLTGCKDEAGAWEFMKWYTGAECQADYSNEMVALIGPSAKHPTANMGALEEMPWTYSEFTQLSAQFNNLASIPNYPGSYIIDRYTNFAFLAAYNENADPVTELQSYITTINKEITRKRAEFDLETLDYVGQTLAQKRMRQAGEALEAAKSNSAYKSAYDDVYNRAIAAMKEGKTEDFAALRGAALALESADASLFASAIGYLRSAANALESYEAYK